MPGVRGRPLRAGAERPSARPADPAKPRREFAEWHARTRESYLRGDAIIAAGEMQFSTYVDKQGQEREGRQVLANTVGASLRYNDVEVNRNPKARGPEAYATGPSATPVADSGAALTR